MDSTIRVYTDGACRGNQKTNNIGAWAFRLEQFDRALEGCNVELDTTNNKMELLAAIKALTKLNDNAKNCKIFVYSDSNYVVQGVMSWRKSWEAKAYKNVANLSYWKELFEQVDRFRTIIFVWVPGHSAVAGNERVDFLCNQAMDKYLEEYK